MSDGSGTGSGGGAASTDGSSGGNGEKRVPFFLLLQKLRRALRVLRQTHRLQVVAEEAVVSKVVHAVRPIMAAVSCMHTPLLFLSFRAWASTARASASRARRVQGLAARLSRPAFMGEGGRFMA